MSLSRELVRELINDKVVTAVYGGGFKPPTVGHLTVVKNALKQFPEIDKFIIYVGGGVRDGVSQEESILVWNIYKKLLPSKVEIQPSKAPVGDVLRYAKNNPEEIVYFVVGAREGKEDDFKDIASRTRGVEEKYPNLKVKTIQTPDKGISGTNARKALKQTPQDFYQYIPQELSQEDKQEVWNLVSPVVKEIKLPSVDDIKSKFNDFIKAVKQEGKESKQALSLLVQAAKGNKELTDLDKQFIKEQLKDVLKAVFGAAIFAIPAGSLVLLLLKAIKLHGLVTPTAFLNENATYSKDIDIIEKCAALTNYMRKKGYNIDPLPSVEFINGDTENAKDFFGKTAYYDPNEQKITLYTEGRHPKDIVRSFAHEMIHHIQNIEGRLGSITTTNTQEDDHLNDIEAEANLKGTMTFRNWTDSLNEIGDASAKVYPYTSTTTPKEIVNQADKFFSIPRSDTFYYEKVLFNFKTDKADYRVTAHTRLERQTYINFVDDPNFKPGPPYKTTISLGFTTEGNEEEEATNLNEQFSVLSTITNIVIDFIEQLNKAGGNVTAVFVPPKGDDVKDSKVDSKRGRLYAAYIKKNLSKIPGYITKEIQDDKGQEAIAIYKTDNLKETNVKDPFGLLEGLLDEVGDASTSPYKWSEEDDDGIAIEVSFETDSGLLYMVQLQRDVYNGIPILDIEFAAGVMDPDTGGTLSSKVITNKGELFKVMSTIVDITKHYIKNTEAQGITYSPSKKGDETISTNQRNTLYKAFLKKQVPGIEFKQNSDYIVALFPGYVDLDENKKESLNEGRYDKFVNQLSKIVFEQFKDIHDRGDKRGEFEFSVGPDDEDIFSDQFEFDLMGVVQITDDEYNVDGGANAGFDDEGEEITPLLSIKFKIPKNPDWQRVSFDIKDVVRHELEHLTQDGLNVGQGKQMADDQMIRNLIDLDLLPKSDYFKLQKEVDAMLQGLYFKAKKSRRPYKDVLNDYLDIFVDQNTISQKEKEEILDIWRSRSKALSLPVFETKYKLKKVMNEQELEQEYKIYCDMDGVLCDFDKRFEEVSGGISPRQYEEQNGKEAFWDLIDNRTGVKFWVGIPWMPKGKELWDYIKQYNPSLLSAPSRNNESRLGKRLWVRNNLSPKPKLILASAFNKPNYSGRNKILIDDRNDTIEKWRAKGGIGILFVSTEQTIKELQELGL